MRDRLSVHACLYMRASNTHVSWTRAGVPLSSCRESTANRTSINMYIYVSAGLQHRHRITSRARRLTIDVFCTRFTAIVELRPTCFVQVGARARNRDHRRPVNLKNTVSRKLPRSSLLAEMRSSFTSRAQIVFRVGPNRLTRYARGRRLEHNNNLWMRRLLALWF